MPIERARATALFSGRVQGVGFRYTAQQVAGRFAVGGYVKNLADGRVELVAEGSRDDIEAFIAAINSNMTRYITDVHITWDVASGKYTRFGVAF